ncbi:hypothetical protein BFR04_07585 [Gaetbulibacter sp. 4G1]|nr:hypothetical protein [Gaetbulibacter sp. 4G1]PIA78084.1 hypothetical protein BFR04_07585 [Gaetbulibacter sp. 4G1]
MPRIKLLACLLTFIIISCDSDKVELANEEPKIDLGKEIISIDIPENFMREDQNLHIVLFDSYGEILDTKPSSNLKETLTFYTKNEFSDETQFSLAFISSSDHDIFGLNIYHNVTIKSLNGKIELKPRGYSKSTPSLKIDALDLDNSLVLNAKGHGYSMVNINNRLSGHYTDDFNENLGPNNILIKYFDPHSVLNDSYKWLLTDNTSTLSKLEVSSFSHEHVEYHQLSTNRPTETPLLDFLGFENETLFNKVSGHQLYGSDIPPFGFGGNHYYSFPNIFYKTAYSISFSDYSLFNVGIPPSSIEVPNLNIDSSYLDGKLTFSGVAGYEVGRIMLDNYNNRINIRLIFDGTSNEVLMPKIPTGILPDNITSIINNGQLRLVQTIAEDYASFSNYNEYLFKVLKTSTPFYINSPKRERVYKPQGTSHILPSSEYPYYVRFR